MAKFKIGDEVYIGKNNKRIFKIDSYEFKFCEYVYNVHNVSEISDFYAVFEKDLIKVTNDTKFQDFLNYIDDIIIDVKHKSLKETSPEIYNKQKIAINHLQQLLKILQEN